jgi:hypothetical protein
MTSEPPLRVRLCATAFVWAPLATLVEILLIAAALKRRHLLASAILNSLALLGCIAALTYAIIVLYRSTLPTRWVFIAVNGVAIMVAGVFLTLFVLEVVHRLAG